VPPQISSPFVGPAGGLAYVEDGRLVVVGADGQATVVAEEGVAHDDRPVAWPPDGRRLLYVTERDTHRKYHPFVDLVWDADGFGGPWAKTEDYYQYSEEPGFEYGGFKPFYDYDEPLMTPEQVLALEPPPSVVIYQ